MLFRKNITRSCAYCRYGAKLNQQEVLCAKRGLVSDEYSCRRFSYDPCKRIPAKQKASDFAKYDNEDYSL